VFLSGGSLGLEVRHVDKGESFKSPLQAEVQGYKRTDLHVASALGRWA
jgi:hypothetical protein